MGTYNLEVKAKKICIQLPLQKNKRGCPIKVQEVKEKTLPMEKGNETIFEFERCDLEEEVTTQKMEG